MPSDSHWPLALMSHVDSRPQKPEGAVVGRQASERQHYAALGLMSLITLSCLACFASSRLALPMEKRLADRVIAVASRRREVAAGLVQGKGQQVDLSFR